jgi:hypothetical protein
MALFHNMWDRQVKSGVVATGVEWRGYIGVAQLGRKRKRGVRSVFINYYCGL